MADAVYPFTFGASNTISNGLDLIVVIGNGTTGSNLRQLASTMTPNRDTNGGNACRIDRWGCERGIQITSMRTQAFHRHQYGDSSTIFMVNTAVSTSTE